MHLDFPSLEEHQAIFELTEVGITQALDNSALVYHLSEPAIPCKNSADAFFGLLHLHFAFEDHERLIDTLIHRAKTASNDWESQDIWDNVQALFSTFDEGPGGQPLTSTKKFDLIRDPAFLKKTTFEDSADIDLLVRTHREKRMMKEFDYAEGMPFVAVVLVAEIFGNRFIEFTEEVSRPNVGGEDVTDRARSDLLSMALVHRTWTRPAQNVLKKRVVLKSWVGARQFLFNPLCGPWTRELVFDPPWAEIDHSQDDSDVDDDASEEPEGFCRPTLKNPFQLVGKLLACMPNLRQLAISLLHRTTMEVRRALDLNAAFAFAATLSELQSLEGLLIRSLALHDVAPERLYFTDICKNLAKLRNLRHLGLHGFYSMDLFPINCRAVPLPLPPVEFGDLTPPPLQRLVLQFPDEPLKQDVASQLWLLGCRDTLEDLFIHFSIPDEDHIRERFVRRMLRIFTPNLAFPKLRKLKFVFINDYEEPKFKGTFGKLCLAFVKNCEALTHLHLSFSAMPKLDLPESLESLTLSFDWDHALGSDPQRFGKWGSKALKLVQSSRLPRLKKVVIEMHCREPIAEIPKGLEMLKMVFSGLVKWGKSHRVAIGFEDERNHDSQFDGRVNKFVFG